MSRIIINNRADISDMEALDRVRAVVEMGKASNNDTQYSYIVRFSDKMIVASGLLKEGHSFTIWREGDVFLDG